MATSGSKDFELDVMQYIEEAFERCGSEARTGYDITTGMRSLNLLLAEWANRGLNRWTISQETLAATEGTSSYSLESGTIDVLTVVVRENAGESTQQDIALTRVNRDAYTRISDKLQEARPSQFYVDRSITPTIKLWPVPDQAYSIVYDRLTRIDDADSPTNTLQVPFRFFPALAAGLAYYLSMKKAPALTPQLQALYEIEFQRAAEEDRDRASYRILPPRGYSRI